jgi:hypothetical protein
LQRRVLRRPRDFDFVHFLGAGWTDCRFFFAWSTVIAHGRSFDRAFLPSADRAVRNAALSKSGQKLRFHLRIGARVQLPPRFASPTSRRPALASADGDSPPSATSATTPCQTDRPLRAGRLRLAFTLSPDRRQCKTVSRSRLAREFPTPEIWIPPMVPRGRRFTQ